MDLVARLHHLLFQIEEHLGEARLLFRERENGFIDHLQTKRRLTPSPRALVTWKRMRASAPGL